MSENDNSETSNNDYGTSETKSPGNEIIEGRYSESKDNFTITAESSRAHWLIFIVNKRTDT